MKTIVTGCATILGLVGALALTGVNCSVEQPRRAQEHSLALLVRFGRRTVSCSAAALRRHPC